MSESHFTLPLWSDNTPSVIERHQTDFFDEAGNPSFIAPTDIVPTGVASELKLWRRWSNQHEQDLRKSSVTMSMNRCCSACGISDLEVRCRSCGTASCILPHPPMLNTMNLSRPTTPSDQETPGSGATSLFSTPRSGSLNTGSDISPIDQPEVGMDNFKISEQDFANTRSGKRPLAMFRPEPRWSPTEGASSSSAVPQIPQLDVSSPAWDTSNPSAIVDDDISASPTQIAAVPYKPYRSEPLPLPKRLTPPHSPRLPRSPRHTQIASVRQSMVEAAKPVQPKKWFERTKSEQTMTFKFVLTPRGQKAKFVVPLADEEGRIIEPSAKKDDSFPKSSSASTHSAPATSSSESELGGEDSGSSKAGAAARPAPTRDMSLGDLARDPNSFQRLLACTMFMMNDLPEKDTAPKRLDLGVAPGRGSSGALAMKHEKKTEHEKDNMVTETKRVMWRISVK